MWKSILQSLLKAVNPLTLIGWVFPKTVAAFETYQSNPNADNIVTLGETAANEFAADFDPALLPVLAEYEADAGPALTAVIAAIEHPGVNTDETALASVILAIAKVRKSTVDPAKLQEALVTICQLINEGIPQAPAAA